MFTSAPQLSTARTSTLTFTVVAKDANNRTMPNQPVDFSATSGSLLGASPTPRTGAAGEAITSVGLSPGADPSNRNILVTLSSAGLARTVTIPVQGTSLAISGPTSLLSGASVPLSVKATDAAGLGIAGAQLTVVSANGNPLTASNGWTTNNSGIVTFSYNGLNAGLDRLNVSGLGASASTTISVSQENFDFVQPGSGTSVPVGVTQQVQVRLLSGATPQARASIAFSTTRGTVSSATALTNADGVAFIDLSSRTAGPAVVTARTPNGAQITLPLVFTASTPASLVLQAEPATLAPNKDGGQTQQSTLQAVVRDIDGNPVSGRTVNFTLKSDGSGGTLSPATGVTDSAGRASTQFIPGPLSTANKGVSVVAQVAQSTVAGSTELTVSGQALFISIGFGNVIRNVANDPTNYEEPFSVLVVDANGRPVRDSDVTLSVIPKQYGKGRLVFSSAGTSSTWTKAPGAVWCKNEDENGNGGLDDGEDYNEDKALTPGSPVTITPGSVRTNEAGIASFVLRYGENQVPWLTVTITARASVAGTESSASLLFPLLGVASDFADANVGPAGEESPYGVATDCKSKD